MNEGDFNDFSSNQSFSYQKYINIDEYYEGATVVSYSNTWYAVLYNNPIHSQDSITVEITINTLLAQTSVETVNYGTGFSFLIIFLGIIVLVGGFIVFVAIVSSRRRNVPYVSRNDRRERLYPVNFSDANYPRENRVLTPRSRRQRFNANPVTVRESMDNSYSHPREMITEREQSNSSLVLFPKFCTKCGNIIAERDKFCTKCGWTIRPIAAGESQTATLSNRIVMGQKATPEKVYGRDTDTCRRCGSLLPVDDKSCSECGAIRAKYPICRRNINFTDIIGTCPECLNEFHHSHLRETIKVNGICPMCRTALHEKDIIIKNHQAK